VLTSAEAVHLFGSKLDRGQELLAGIEEAAVRHDLTAIGAHAQPGRPSLGGWQTRSSTAVTATSSQWWHRTAAGVALGAAHP
jgi:hypothetical protein